MFDQRWIASLRLPVRNLLLMTVILTASSEHALGADCQRDDRKVDFTDGSSQIRSYACKVDNSETPQLRIEFHRLSELSAGNLLMGVQSPARLLLGQPKVLRTDVGVEAKKLFDQFSTKQTVSGCLSFSVEAPKGGKDYQGAPDCKERSMVFFNSSENDDTSAMPLPDDNRLIKTTAAWPSNYHFYYMSQCDNPITCTVIWRPTTPYDFDSYKNNWHRQNRLEKIDDTDPSLIAAQSTLEKYFGLARYLMRDAWRDDFLVITGIYDACGGYLFHVYPRKLILDVATVENISSSNIRLNGIMTTESAGGLRPAKSVTVSDKGPKTLEYNVELAPREKALVPLRMTWPASSDLSDLFGDRDKAGTKYASIQNSPKGTMFNVKEGGRIVLRKVREGFGAPSRPEMDDLIYGPILELTGVIANGKTVSLNERTRNFLNVTVSSEGGSCPFLYAWQPDTEDWTLYGKVIHRAKLKAKEMTQQISLTRFANRFRLSEQELELSHIDYAALTIDLGSGIQHILKPTNVALSEIDENYVEIPAGASIEFEFELPSDLKDVMVKRSTLTIRGYYEPYSQLNIGSNPVPSSAVRTGLGTP
jgi:hypothetical protein